MTICDTCKKDGAASGCAIWIELRNETAHMDAYHPFTRSQPGEKVFCSLRCLKTYANSIPEDLFRKLS